MKSKMFEKLKNPPIAKKEPVNLEIHGDIRKDPYYWMKLTDEQKEKENPDQQTKDVISYLTDENDYKEKVLSHTSQFQEYLFNEIKGRIKQTDLSVPYKDNGYFYLSRYEEGKEYPIYSRKKDNLENEEEILLDVNEMSKGYEYYHIGSKKVSTDNRILAFSEDAVSRRIYTIRFKNLETGDYLEDQITNTSGSMVWANDNKTIFYTVKDHTLRSYKVFKHILGTPITDDIEIYHETQEAFITYLFKTKSKKYIVIGSHSTVSQEYRFVDANMPSNDFKIFQTRERDLEYNIDHLGNKWYIRTNKNAKNFKLMSANEEDTNKENWQEVIPHREDVLLEGMELFKDYLVLSERIKGITNIRILSWDRQNDHYINFGEEAFLMYPGNNLEAETEIFRLEYTSLTTPNTTYDYNMRTHEKTLLKQQEVVGDFEPQNYASERLYAPSHDGVLIPISLVYRKETTINGTAPLLLYAYGSYGHSMDPYFSSVRLSLLDRGFIFAIAHIRGGEELGRKWYEDGKLLNKKNTFLDFIHCGKYLVDERYADKNELYAMGGSAGGLLMGAVVNMAPEMWKGVIAAVPFVDVITTMLDTSIPLTTGEYDEWGNPNKKEYYDYIKSYSPYDNVESKAYPPMLVTTGYYDSQVQYWEPAKWVAKLRDLKTDQNPLLLHTNMSAGHGGASGRFRRFKETAMEYAFLLDLAGKIEELNEVRVGGLEPPTPSLSS